MWNWSKRLLKTGGALLYGQNDVQSLCEKAYWDSSKKKRQELAVKHWQDVKAGNIAENDLLMKLKALSEQKQKTSVWEYFSVILNIL